MPDFGDHLQFDMAHLSLLKYNKGHCIRFLSPLGPVGMFARWLWNSTQRDRNRLIWRVTAPAGPYPRACVPGLAPAGQKVTFGCPKWKSGGCRCGGGQGPRMTKSRWGKFVQVTEQFIADDRLSFLKSVAWLFVTESGSRADKTLQSSHIDGTRASFNCITQGHAIIESPTHNRERRVHDTGNKLCNCEPRCPLTAGALNNLIALTCRAHRSQPSYGPALLAILDRYPEAPAQLREGGFDLPRDLPARWFV